MQFNNANHISWRGKTTAEHIEARDYHSGKGFRPLSLALSGTPSDPRYSAVMVKRPTVIATKSFIGLDRAGFRRTFDEMEAIGYGAFILTATGTKDSPLFAASFRKMDHINFTKPNLSKQEFIDINKERREKGRILLWADSFGTAADTRYCAIWTRNPDRVFWNADAVDEPSATMQQRFDAMLGVYARPLCLSITPSGQLMESFVDSKIGEYSQVGLTDEAGYDYNFQERIVDGLYPVCIAASGSGSATRYAAVFARQEKVFPRTFTGRGTPAVATIDAKVEGIMRHHNYRGCSLAIVKGTRLVYARGYNLSEPAGVYPEITPETCFRQASVSKLFCAVAIWRLIRLNKLELSTKIQSILNLTQTDGTSAPVAGWEDITVQHLLESCSGIVQGTVRDSIEASNAAGGALPASVYEIARLAASRPLRGTPGDRDITYYGSTDYFLLSLIAAKKMDVSTFDRAMSLLVYEPLGMTHSRGSRSTIGVQLPGEAPCHIEGLPLGSSLRSPAQPLVPVQYGTFDMEAYEGAGGISSSAVDMARLAAVFSCRSGNPLLRPGDLDDMFALAVAASRDTADQDEAHGFHGFDGPTEDPVGSGIYTLNKAGGLDGFGASITGTTGGYFYCFSRNGAKVDSNLKWTDEICPDAEAHNWGDADHFPDFGMKKLGSSRFSTAPTHTPIPHTPIPQTPVLRSSAFEDMEERSMRALAKLRRTK